MKGLDLRLAAALILGIIAYLVAATTSFNFLQPIRVTFVPGPILLLTILGGICVIGLGYLSMVILGGRFSLGVANFFAWISRSKQVFDYDNQSPKGRVQRIIEQTYLLYAAGIVFLLLVAIAWDLHNADGPHAGIFYPILNATNIFLTQTSTVGPVRFSIHSLPLLLFLTILAGITPSLTLPYLRNFKITSVSSGSFHTSLLSTVIGLVAGLTVLLTIVGFVYKVLWAGAARASPSYHFVLLVMLGFSIHFAAGSYMARDRTERAILQKLQNEPTNSRVFLGTVDVKPRLSKTPNLKPTVAQPQVGSRSVQEKQAH